MDGNSPRDNDDNRRETSSFSDVTRNNRPDRFRYTYELDHYEHNAMLIITNDFTPEINITVRRLKETFEKFRFDEIEMIFDRNENIYRRCEEYFKRNFTSYGALAVVVIPKKLSPNTEGPILEAYIMQHFNSPTLKDKPVIYIASDNSLFTIKRLDSRNHCPHLLSLVLPNLKQYPFEHTPFFVNLIHHLNGMVNGDDLEKMFCNVIREATDRINDENERNNELVFLEIPPHSGAYWVPKTSYPELNSTLTKRILLYNRPA